MRQRIQSSALCCLLSLVILPALASGINSQSNQNPQPSPKPQTVKTVSLLANNTLFTVYGKAFDAPPILGHLGTYKSFEDMEKDIQPWIQGIDKRNDGKGVIPAVHLIYAMAYYPCKPSPDDCLMYLEGTKKDLVATYIQPAAKRGWMVILDTQVAKSDPVTQVKRIIDKGYLNYENVAVAIDPEFHVYPGRARPGIPIGVIQASQINEVQQMLDDYVRTHNQTRKKILIVHQFGDPNVHDGIPFMIQHKKDLKTYDNVDLVIDMDGFGEQAVKVAKYNKITDSKIYPIIKYRGIKVFFPNNWEHHGHYDKPPMNLDQIFGLEPAKDGPKMRTKPDVLIIC
jgi:hypothetical protein